MILCTLFLKTSFIVHTGTFRLIDVSIAQHVFLMKCLVVKVVCILLVLFLLQVTYSVGVAYCVGVASAGSSSKYFVLNPDYTSFITISTFFNMKNRSCL